MTVLLRRGIAHNLSGKPIRLLGRSGPGRRGGYYFNGVNEYVEMGQPWSCLGRPEIYQEITYDVDVDGGYVIDGSNPISEFGRTSEGYHRGRLAELRITDKSPTQNRWVFVGNDSAYFASANPISMGADDMTLEFNWLRYDRSGTSGVRACGSGDGINYVIMNDSAAVNANRLAFFYTGGSLVQLEGVAAVPLGKQCTIGVRSIGGTTELLVDGEVVGSGDTSDRTDFIFDRLYKADIQPCPANSFYSDFHLINLTTGEEWFWPVDEGGGTVVMCYADKDKNTRKPLFDMARVSLEQSPEVFTGTWQFVPENSLYYPVRKTC